MEEQVIQTIVQEFSETFRADGGDLVLVSCGNGTVQVEIRIGPNACRECIMAPEDVKQILESSIEGQTGKSMKVEIKVVDLA